MSKRRIDRSTAFGFLLALTGVITGILLDGGSLRPLLQPTAALIVLGGTLGAVMVQFPLESIVATARQLPHALFDRSPLCADAINELVGYCAQIRRYGILSLDPRLDQVEDDFMRKALTLAVDGVHLTELRESLEVDLDLYDEREYTAVNVLDAAGGFAPTLGIMGAVLGLIQVMQRMDNVGEIGKGIAVAFVSTLYGLGLANLLFIPLAGKLRIRMRQRQLVREMTLEAIVYVMQGIGPRALKDKLEAYLTEKQIRLRTITAPEMANR